MYEDLETHHAIEEASAILCQWWPVYNTDCDKKLQRFFFPILAKRMPAFADDEQHKKSHEDIHKGLSTLPIYIT